jgi:catechol 2,3-dioxygenase-like lactoylglutathione lyase family enzyme
VPNLGIERTNYVALAVPDPEASAQFAVDHMGFFHVHSDSDGRQYLAAHGLDPYSLVYTPGEGPIDHISYVVRELATLEMAAETLADAGVETELVEQSPLWRHEPALRFKTPNGHTIELTPGVDVDIPMAALTSRPAAVPAPITCDHVVVRAIDVETEIDFAVNVMGLRESSRIEAPDVGSVLSFYRCHTLYHCFAIARAPFNGMHHHQFTLKDVPSVFDAYESMRDGGKVELIWGPLRHGPGHNVAFYFRDYAGNFVEYSAEEEVILDNDTYWSQRFTVLDGRAADEWGTHPPDVFF